jgi:hypothetical protein
VTETQSATNLSSKGLRLALSRRCQSRTLDVWCPVTEVSRGECKVPSTIREQQDVACPRELDFRSVQVSIISPWGAVYGAMSDGQGIADVPVDWSTTGVDPLDANAPAKLATNWKVFADEDRTVPLKLSPEQVERMLIAIGTATDTQYEVGAANEKATLSAELRGAAALVPGKPAHITLTIKNSGPRPAYRVIAKLQSSVPALHGHQLSFGRINPGITKIRSRLLSLPQESEDRTALVVAEVTYFTGDPVSTRKRDAIVREGKPAESPRELALACKLATPEVMPGGRVQIGCDVRNLSSGPMSELTVKVLVRGVETPNSAPRNLPGGTVKLELNGKTSDNEQQGAVVPVQVRISAPGHPAVEQSLLVRISATRCQVRLTRAEYQVRLVPLQELLDKGGLSQKEFDKYDAELVACLQ